MKQNKRIIINVLFWTMFIFYIYLMIELLFLRVGMDHRSINLIPFKTISHGIVFYEGYRLPFINIQVWANIFIFVPVGLCLMLLRKKDSILKPFLTVFLISLGVEILQCIIKVGVCDIDDLILNCFGGIIGILIYCLLKKMFKSKERVKTAITILSLIIGAPYLIMELLVYYYNYI